MFSLSLMFAFIFVFSIFTKCHHTLETHPESYAKTRDGIKGRNSTSALPYGHIENFGTGAKEDNGQSISIPIEKEIKPDAEDVKTIPNKDLPGIVLEGGDVLQQTSSPLPKHDEVTQLTLVTIDDKVHSKGSKGRKGVQYPNSSVVARKGVELHGALQANKTSTSNLDSPVPQLFMKNSTINVEKTTESKVEITRPQEGEIQSHNNNIHKTHSKKPEVVSDEGDVDDFDQYSIIKTSTTGEDYVIIGIVIVIGIWFSVFGALIFYRRAGEYWDRRHYRRMDFLVEGMYND